MSHAPMLIPRILDVLVWPDPKLKLESKPVTVFDDELEEFITDMFATMDIMEGVGLSAPQVNRQERIITLRIEPENPMVIINPEIIESSNNQFEWEEGCLSVPGYYKKKKRPSRIVVTFQDPTGKPHEIEFNGLYAFAVQHEIDHLNGICFVDKGSRIWYPKIKKVIKRELPKLKDRVDLAKIELLKQKEN